MDRHGLFLMAHVAALFLLLPSSPARAGECLSFEPAVVEITGSLWKKAQSEKPGLKNGQQKVSAGQQWVFLPDTDNIPCVNTDPATSEIIGPERDIYEFQVVFSRKDVDENALYKQFLHRKVILKGTVSKVPSAPWYTPLLIKVIDLEPLLTEADKCLSYEPTVVTITGRMYEKTLPGRPNYESTEHGDEPATYWFMKTDKPFCVYANVNDEIDEDEKDVTDVQLVFTRDDVDEYDLYRDLLSKKVAGKGTFYHAHTAHHRTKILLTVETIEPIPPK